MQIQINTDNNITMSTGLGQRIETDTESTLSRFSDRITRVEIHLGDENAEKPGSADKRCTLQARPAGQQPIAVTHDAASVDEAFDGALHKLETRLQSAYARSEHHKGGPSIRHLPVAEGLS